MYERALWKDESAHPFIKRAFSQDEVAGSPSGDVWEWAYGVGLGIVLKMPILSRY